MDSIQVSQHVVCNGYRGVVRVVCSGQLEGMAEVALERGSVCVGISELREGTPLNLFTATLLRWAEWSLPPVYSADWEREAAPLMVSRIMKQLEAGQKDRDNIALMRTCRELGIRHTYKAIAAYLAQETI